MPSSIRDLLRLPSRIALMLGLGALSVAGAKADTGTQAQPGRDSAGPPMEAGASSGLRVWREDGRIYLSEAGRAAEELRLGSTAEADLLRQLLEREGVTTANPRVLGDRVRLAGTGGSGLHWDSDQPPSHADKTRAPVVHGPSKPAAGTAKPDAQLGAAQQPVGADLDTKK
jgi:hypothetical protein